MVDIHSHILWGLDDGPETKADSLAMLRLAAGSGTTAIVASPHKDSRFGYDIEVVNARILELQAEVRVPRIYRGCDFHLSLENISEALEHPRKYTINSGPYLLVEFADTFIPPTTENIFRQFIASEIIPVITHPERNAILSGSLPLLQRWVEMGCLIQITAQALTERFGKDARAAAWTLLRRNLVHAIASDAHDTEYRPPRLDEARQMVKRELGSKAADLLLVQNPEAIISGGVAASACAKSRKASRWRLWLA